MCSHIVNQSWATLSSVQAQQLLALSFILLHNCNVEPRTVCGFRTCCVPISVYWKFYILLPREWYYRKVVFFSKSLRRLKAYNVLQYCQRNKSKWKRLLSPTYLSVIRFHAKHFNMCSRFVRLCCCPCLLCLCLWSVRRMAQRWTLMNSSWPCRTTPCSWLWSLDRHGHHSLYTWPNTSLIYDIQLAVL